MLHRKTSAMRAFLLEVIALTAWKDGHSYKSPHDVLDAKVFFLSPKYMKQLKKIKTKQSPIKKKFSFVTHFLFSNALGISGSVTLFIFLLTHEKLFLYVATLLSLFITLYVFVISLLGLIDFGVEKVIAETEIKFLDVTLNSGFVVCTSLLVLMQL